MVRFLPSAFTLTLLLLLLQLQLQLQFVTVLGGVAATATASKQNDDISIPTTTTAGSTQNDSSTAAGARSSDIIIKYHHQIATLNSSPQRCLHISSATKGTSNSSNKAPPPLICTNFPYYSDGTNGCKEYAMPSNKSWCKTFGHFSYPSTPHNPNQACCTCGGGTRFVPRFQAGTYITLKGHSFNGLDQCKGLKIADVGHGDGVFNVGTDADKPYVYMVEVTKACGQTMYRRTRQGIETTSQFSKGMTFEVHTDDPNAVRKHIRVELRKCRKGVEEQEFELLPHTGNTNANANAEDDLALGSSGPIISVGNYTVTHILTGTNLSESLKVQGMNPIDIQRAFGDDLFQGSEEYFFMKVEAKYLASGKFGETEYSEVEWQDEEAQKFLHEVPFTMWSFRHIQEENEGDNENGNGTTCAASTVVVDEHAAWLTRMTESIGIDYLQELAPWHLLDVEREASKNDVKARFRELSRSFHPDKVHASKRELFEKIFQLLQNAYEGLKNTDEEQKEKFRSSADTDSQLFAHSKHVIELLPFHWTKLGIGDDDEDEKDDAANDSNVRYVINTATHLNATNAPANETETETGAEVATEKSVQIWVLFLYSTRCGMSRAIEGFVDLAARHLEQYEDIKVGAYGCGLYNKFKSTQVDRLGVDSDPICKQFQRRETPNVHVVVETLLGDEKEVAQNAKFKYFYASVPHGNTTEFYPHNIIKFAKAGKRIWNDSHLVKKMKTKDFAEEDFKTSVSIVAYIDGTGLGETNQEVQDTITTALPGLARRFMNANVYVSITSCGWGYGDDDDLHVDCSQLDVSWLPDIKIYGANETSGVSLLRNEFGDRRDVQIGAFFCVSNIY